MKNVWEGDGLAVTCLSTARRLSYGLSRKNAVPRPRATAGGAEPVIPLIRSGRALAHVPHRSDSRPPHTPRGVR
ncbi:hypothetical protein GCM10010420_24630 [Streptomyces glaucosporus]|uniref:Uncharacterized protein n=1 Tax=Streptomyces glaucosporus TaxID=284044 RepID=A0ABP5VAD3_9ACTN